MKSFPKISLADQPAHIRLLILLAKVDLSETECQAANALLDAVTDWDVLLDMASRNFSLPLLRRNLGRLDQARIPSEIQSRIQLGATQIAFQNMRMIAAQKAFQDTCLRPLKIDGVFFKGVSIAAQYYPDLGLRPCRDIDVLVPKGSLRRVLNAAVEAGYIPVSPDGNATPLTSARDIDTMLTFGESVTMITPEQVVIDLQDHLDKHSGIFSAYDLDANATEFQIAGETFKTLPTDFLINYICHHHTRHTWSRLHWLSDLDAICSSPQFDRDATLALAEQLGQSGTVKASLDLHQLMSTDTPWEGEGLDRGKTFLTLCILNLPGDLDLEKQLGLQMKGGEFMFDWQARATLIAKARRGWWRTIFRPTVSQYARMPLPKALHWVYYILRPFELLIQAQKRLRLLRN